MNFCRVGNVFLLPTISVGKKRTLVGTKYLKTCASVLISSPRKLTPS